MAIQTTVEPRVKWWTVAYLVICVAIGIWGWYDYAIRLPQNQAEAERYQHLLQEFTRFETLDEQRLLSDAQREEWAAVDDELVAFGGRVPEEPARWDRPVKLWLYVILSGGLGVVWFGTSLILLHRRRYRLDDDGSLEHPDGRWTKDEIVGIDMDRWMEKSIATVRHRDGTRIKLDAYKYRDLHLIIGEIAHRFEPDRWHRDGRLVKGKKGAANDDGGPLADSPREDFEAIADDDADDRGDAPRDGEAGSAQAAEGAGPTDPTRT